MDSLPHKAISSVPKLANRTPFAFVIDSFLVRAADYAIGHYDQQYLVLLDEFQYLSRDAGVRTNITTIYLPVAQLRHFCILGWHNANSNLRRLAQVRTVERNRGKWPTPQSPSSSFSQAL